MTKQHTPGPWHVEPAPNRVHFAVRNDGVHVVTGWREGAANARLIAAAPDLLEALRRLVDACDHEKISGSQVTNARAAITKAEEG